MRAVLILALLGLAACGADGEPVRPTADATVSVGSGGAGVSTSVTLTSGPVSAGVSS